MNSTPESTPESSNILCPFCSQYQIKKNGTVIRKNSTFQRYFCSNCRKSFSKPIQKIEKNNIYISDSFLNGIVEGKSCKEISENLSISTTTAYENKKKIMECIQKETENIKFRGVIEFISFNIASSNKGQKNLNRKPRKTGTNSTKDLTIVVMMDEYGNSKSKIYQNNLLNLDDFLVNIDEKGSYFRVLNFEDIQENQTHISLFKDKNKIPYFPFNQLNFNQKNFKSWFDENGFNIVEARNYHAEKFLFEFYKYFKNARGISTKNLELNLSFISFIFANRLLMDNGLLSEENFLLKIKSILEKNQKIDS